MLHAGIGKVSFAEGALKENFAVLANAVVAARPKKAKGSNFGGYVLKARPPCCNPNPALTCWPCCNPNPALTCWPCLSCYAGLELLL